MNDWRIMKLWVYFALYPSDWSFKYWFKSFRLVMLDNASVSSLLYCIAEHSMEELQFCCSPGALHPFTMCSIAMGRIYEVWLLPLHAPAVRIPAHS